MDTSVFVEIKRKNILDRILYPNLSIFRFQFFASMVLDLRATVLDWMVRSL